MAVENKGSKDEKVPSVRAVAPARGLFLLCCRGACAGLETGDQRRAPLTALSECHDAPTEACVRAFTEPYPTKPYPICVCYCSAPPCASHTDCMARRHTLTPLGAPTRHRKSYACPWSPPPSLGAARTSTSESGRHTPHLRIW